MICHSTGGEVTRHISAVIVLNWSPCNADRGRAANHTKGRSESRRSSVEVFDVLCSRLLTDRARFYKELATALYGANRPVLSALSNVARIV